MARLNRIFVLMLLLFPSLSFGQSSIEGNWKESLSIGFDFAVKFTHNNGVYSATMDIPAQKAMGLPLQNVSFNDPVVHFELDSPVGLAVCEGELKNDSIKGKFTQGSVKADFYLVRGILELPKEETVVVPYKQEEIEFHNGNVKLAGTLTLPEYPGNHPAVVLITGSGAQDRNEDILGFKIFGIIADRLTRNGIAVLRYDDRGIGGSTGSVPQSTSEDFAKDVSSAVRYLQTRNDIRKDAVGLLGHSEGGIVAPLAYTMNKDIAFMVLMAGTGVTGKDIVIEQSDKIMRADNLSEAIVTQNLGFLRMIFDGIEQGRDVSALKEDIKNFAYTNYDKLPADEQKAIGEREAFAEQLYREHANEFGTPWFKYFSTYDPVKSLEKVDIPVLMLFGELDLQVLPSQNRQPMEDALKRAGNKDVTTVVFPKANHLFQTAVTGSPTEYGKLEKQFTDGFLDTITEWILKRAPVSR